ncbi:hypothetical protein QAD02_018271 [Eretmocerus hayati]|uniref:Uncharacterized protein n=1 Tax=Eretmocerus hayati TaxID=131215 RepID=A0ACC2PFX1_9HYME|nr:hypothetical protein QAD02_018271 [Eretmocerus hayati]
MAGALSESAPRPVSVIQIEDSSSSSCPVIVTSDTSPEVPKPEIVEEVVILEQNAPIRTFTSTEAQTELLPHPVIGSTLSTGGGGCGGTSGSELLLPPGESSRVAAEANRCERRARRQHRRAIQRANDAAVAAAAAAAVNGACAAAIPPTYGGPLIATSPLGPPPHPPVSAASFLGQPPPPHHLGLRGLSFGLPFPVPTAASVSGFTRDPGQKQCCGLNSPPVRWSIFGVGVVGLICAGAGALLGALRASGRDHIAVALLMIGIGVVLITVSAVAWRVTSHENCGDLFGLSSFSRRIPPARPMHPYAAMIYPEFQFRAPPPSYQASMQEYRLRLLLLDRLQPTTSSPPPTYRSNAGTVTASSGHHVPAQLCREVTPAICQPAKKKDANLVRIVQTENEPVILSGDQTPPVSVESAEVLAHL